jgi:hypothetical protein
MLNILITFLCFLTKKISRVVLNLDLLGYVLGKISSTAGKDRIMLY